MVLPAGSQLIRVHSPDFTGVDFNPCKGLPSRFAPLKLPAGDCLPTLYAATTFECAVHESIFHELPYNASRKVIREDKVITRAVSWLVTKQDLEVVRLNEPDLNRLGLTRADLIDTPNSGYDTTARWAESLHRGNPTAAGLAWTSRRCDPDQAYVFFEDRVPPRALAITKRVDLATSPSHLAEVRQFGQRAGITITLR